MHLNLLLLKLETSYPGTVVVVLTDRIISIVPIFGAKKSSTSKLSFPKVSVFSRLLEGQLRHCLPTRDDLYLKCISAFFVPPQILSLSFIGDSVHTTPTLRKNGDETNHGDHSSFITLLFWFYDEYNIHYNSKITERSSFSTFTRQLWLGRANQSLVITCYAI